MVKNREFKINKLLQFFLVQIVYILLYRILKVLGQNYTYLKWIHLILLITNEFLFFYIFWESFRRKKIIDNLGHIKESLRNKIHKHLSLKYFLIISIYFLLNIILRDFIKLVFPCRLSIVSSIEPIVLLIMLLHLLVEFIRIAILDQFEVYIQIKYIVFIVVILSSFSNDILLTFLVSTLLLGLINWFVSEDAFRYSQELMNIATNLEIDIDTRSKKILSKIRARSLFASISYNISIIVSSFILEKTPVHNFFIDFAIAFKFVGKDNTTSQIYFSNFIVKVSIWIICYFFLKISVDGILKSRVSHGIPVISSILNNYDKLILEKFNSIIDTYPLAQISRKRYYINKMSKYFSKKRWAKIYICFDESGLLDHYILSKTYKRLKDTKKYKYYKMGKKGIIKQLDILSEVLESQK